MRCCVFFFFKQKTAYEMRISDWSSDVCSSDLVRRHVAVDQRAHADEGVRADAAELVDAGDAAHDHPVADLHVPGEGGVVGEHAVAADLAVVGEDRKSVVEGKRVSVRVDVGGRVSIKKKNKVIIIDVN